MVPLARHSPCIHSLFIVELDRQLPSHLSRGFISQCLEGFFEYIRTAYMHTQIAAATHDGLRLLLELLQLVLEVDALDVEVQQAAGGLVGVL